MNQSRRRFGRMLLGASAVLPAAALSRHAAHAQSGPKITITEPLAWLRSEPSLYAGNLVPVRKGEFYTVNARSADNRWWRLNAPSARGKDAWLYASLGAIHSGALANAPVYAKLPTPVRTVKPAKSVKAAPAFPPWVPVITPQQRAIYQGAAKFGKDLNMFTVIGDCNSQPPVYLRRVATGEFDGSRVEPRIQQVLARFEGAFGRVSLAAKGGFGTAAMGDPTWADGALCDVTMGPFECEVWVSRASVVFIELGTGDQLVWKQFEGHYRPLVELALKKGPLPVLVTKADDIETSEDAPSGYINDIVRKLASEYQVPLLDFHAATRNLPNFGLIDEGDKDFHLNDAGIFRHLEATLQTLAAISQG
jgi:hypothetical protein